MQEIRDAIPAKYFDRSTTAGTLYLIQDIIMASGLFYAALYIDPWFNRLAVDLAGKMTVNTLYIEIGRWAAWAT